MIYREYYSTSRPNQAPPPFRLGMVPPSLLVPLRRPHKEQGFLYMLQDVSALRELDKE